jgi:hypothetical protein
MRACEPEQSGAQRPTLGTFAEEVLRVNGLLRQFLSVPNENICLIDRVFQKLSVLSSFFVHNTPSERSR